MANQRPIRRGRVPFRKRRPTRWVDAFTSGRNAGLKYGFPWELMEAPVFNSSRPTVVEIVAGDTDTASLDRQEVLVTRIVGDLSFYTTSGYDSDPPVPPPVVRLGLIVEEDAGAPSSTTSVELYNLWDNTAMQNLEWMWLQQVTFQVAGGSDPVAPVGHREFHAHVHLDVRSKRKLGKADRLWLVTTYGNGVDGGLDVTNTFSAVYQSRMLRALIVV